MEYGNIESIIDYSVSPHDNFSQDKEKRDEGLEGLLTERVNALSHILRDIEVEIKYRRDLSYKIIERIYQHYIYVKNNVFELYHWELGRNRAIEIRRVRLQKQLDVLLQEKRGEQVKCFQDISKLKKEFRGWFKQYQDLLLRARLILPKRFSSKKG